GFALADANVGLNTTATSAAIAERKKAKGAALATWAENLFAAAQGGLEPEFVQVRPLGVEGIAPPIEGVDVDRNDDPALAVFRADWIKAQYIGTGMNSVVIGFTTDLPPVDMAIRVDNGEAAAAAEGSQIIGLAGAGMAPGLAPSPRVPLAAVN